MSAAGFVVGQVRVRTAVITAPFCTIFASQSKAEFSLDINVAPRTRRMTGRIIFADDTLPVEATGFIKVLIDSSAINQGVVSFASPYILDLDVTDKSRVTIRVSIPEGSQATLNRATFVLVEGEFAT